MCGRYTLIADPEFIKERFQVEEFSETQVEPRFNIAPSQQVPVVLPSARGRALRLMTWGFRPPWMREDPRRPAPINARAETAVTSPLFRGALARGRCLVPASGFYEWRAIPGQKAKQPMYIRLKGGAPFAFAGLYTGQPEAADKPPTCAILTTTPNALMEPIHTRMPVILEAADEARWLDPTITDPREILPLLRPAPADAMEAYPVSTLVNAVRNHGPHLIQAIA